MSVSDAATLGELVDAAAARWPVREAIVFEGERLTFADLRDRARRLARGLRALGIGPGDPVAIWLPNRPAWFVVQHACARLDAPVVALNPRYRAHELAYILGQSEARALVLTDHLGPVDYLATLEEVLPGLARAVPGELDAAAAPHLRHVIVDSEDEFPGCTRLGDVLAAGDEAEAPDLGPGPGPDDVLTILYTSGTTAFPKGAMISHRNAVPHGWHCGEVLRLTPEDRVLHALPAAGTWGGLNIPLTAWSHGACLVLMDVFDPGRALWLVERERCTVWNAVDQMARAVLDHPDLDRHDRRSLRTGGFAATGGGGHGLFEAVVERIGIRQAFQPYGMTEVNAMALVHDLDEPAALRALPGIRPVPGLEVRVVHPESGAACAADEEGELQFRGPRVTRGYWGKPEETARAFTEDGWFRSGDLGVRTAEGHLIFRGRLREVLRISHHMVATGEIEAFLMSHPDVHQAFVVGIPDPRTGEAAAAFVILRLGARLTEEALLAFCRGRIASFKIPRLVRFVADVPRTPGPHGDKVQRALLREQARREAGLKEAAS
ncbi:MAG: AMP-binding protein [Candidatus Rokubacteria bacterium]|nr:AMP-binding protein [Candidatus Rokubacteria bacterium]